MGASPMNGSKTAQLFVCAALVVAALVLLVACDRAGGPNDGDGERAAAPCAGAGCEPRDVSGMALFSAPSGGAGYEPEETASVEDALEKGLRQSEASPAHLAIRGTAGPSRCAWRGIARTSAQREQAVRFWLDLDAGDSLPSAAETERRFMAELDRINAVYPATVRSNFQAMAQGGLSTGYLFLACYADYTVNEYLLGSGPATLTVAYDRQGEGASYGLYVQAHALGEFGDEALLSEGAYEDELSQRAFTMEAVLNVLFGDREGVVMLAPMGAHNAIAVEAWQAVEQWDLQTDDDDVVHAVRYGVPPGDPEHTQTLASLKTRITTAAAADAFADDRIGNVSGLAQYYRDIGAYGDITPDDGSTATFTPAQPPPAYSCAGGAAVTSPAVNAGLVHDCEALLAAKDTLRGTATLDWSASTAIASWEGVTTSGTPSRVTELDLSSESLSGSIPAALGTLFELTTLDLSANSLTGDIPRELGWLFNLEEIRLSGNSLTGCVPIALREVATNDLSSLNLPYCRPPAPGAPTAGTAGETSVPLSWTAAANTTAYRVEHRSDGAWTVDDETITGTTHTVDGLSCERAYQFRVSAYGSGTVYAATWSEPSAVLSASTSACVPPVFGQASYRFSVMEDAAVDAAVGTVSATDNSGEPVSYAITAGNEAGRFAIDEETGAITVAASLSGNAGTTAALTVEAQDPDGTAATATVTVAITQTCDSGTAAPNPAANAGLVADCKTLLGLQAALAGTATLNWSADLAMGSWEGVQVGRTPQRVTWLDLNRKALTGVIPSALGDLARLRYLRLDYNQLTGSIPATLGQLTALRNLRLNNNQLSGPIPAALGSLTDLNWFHLQDNDLTGPIPPELGNLTSVYDLSMQNNDLSGTIPAELTALRDLITLRLNGNDLVGCVPPSLRDIRSNDLGSLGLPDCQAGPGAPTGISATWSAGTFTVTWTALSGVGAYEVQWRTDEVGSPWAALPTVTTASAAYSPTGGPACSTTYEFRVRARGDGYTHATQWGPESAADTAAAPSCPPEFGEDAYAFTVAEDAAAGDLVGTVSATDPDRDVPTYAITGTAFAVDGGSGAVTVAGDLDHEATPSYTLTVTADDQKGGTDTATVIVTVTDVVEDAPPAPENLDVTLAGGTFTLGWDAVTGAAAYEAQHTTDAVDAETVTWTVLAETAGLTQTYSPTDGAACGTTYRFRVRAYGDGAAYTAMWGMESEAESVTTATCPPEFDPPSYAFEVAEDAAVDAEVGTVSATDPDDDALTYSITAGDAQGQFAVDGDGVVTVAAALDHETTPSYDLTVEADDGKGGVGTAMVTVTVTDVAEDAPPAPGNLGAVLSNDVFTLRWDAVTGASAYEAQATTDAVDAETVTWTALAETAGLTQTYSPTGGAACGTTYRFRVRAYGDGAAYTAMWGPESAAEAVTTATCPLEFDPPSYAFEVSEDAAVDAEVGTVSATDPDDDALTYSITAGDAQGQFAVDGDGVVTVAAALDHETTPSYTLTVQADDMKGGTDTATVIVTVTDVAEDAPPAPGNLGAVLSNDVFTLRWDAVTGASAYEAQATTDAETVTWTALAETAGLTQTYSPTGGAACGTTYRFRVRAYGDGAAYTAMWGPESAAEAVTTATCPLEFDPPSYAFEVSEDAAVDAEVGTVSATDPDDDALTYSITAGDAQGQFAVDGDGVVTVAAALDHETTPSYTLTVQADDMKGGTDTATVIVTVTDVVEDAPPAPENLSVTLADDVFTLTWTAVSGADRYEAQATTDASDAETVTWTALAETAGLTQTYSPTGGAACGTTYRFRVRAYGDGAAYTAMWGPESAAEAVTTATCPLEFDPPSYAFEVSEDAAVDAEVGTVSATDPDDDALTYSITAGDAQGQFAVDGDGVVTVAAALDHETTPSYTLTVQADDMKGGTDTATVIVTVTDVVEDAPPAPENLSVTLADDVFTLTWTAVSGADRYEAQVTTDAADAATVTWAALPETHRPDPDLHACGRPGVRHDLPLPGAGLWRRGDLHGHVGAGVRGRAAGHGQLPAGVRSPLLRVHGE